MNENSLILSKDELNTKRKITHYNGSVVKTKI